MRDDITRADTDIECAGDADVFSASLPRRYASDAIFFHFRQPAGFHAVRVSGHESQGPYQMARRKTG